MSRLRPNLNNRGQRDTASFSPAAIGLVHLVGGFFKMLITQLRNATL
jgi:hypothetical protein